jgi:Zn finger protein HypA/HybF involved in hydrogenase expression
MMPSEKIIFQCEKCGFDWPIDETHPGAEAMKICPACETKMIKVSPSSEMPSDSVVWA